jgi:hypothetical protein
MVLAAVADSRQKHILERCGNFLDISATRFGVA